MKKISTLLFLSLFYLNAISQTVVASYDFETGLDSWVSDLDSGLNTNLTYACGGSQSVFVRDNNSTSKIDSPTLNLSGYGSVDFSFCYKSDGLDTGEGIQIEYSSDNGTTWTPVISYLKGTDFPNSGSGYTYSFLFSLNACDYTLSSAAKFRIVGNASKSTEYSYIDNVLIEGYTATQEINILGNSNLITSGDLTPSTVDGTDFGTIAAPSTATHVFTIQNLGSATLNLTGSPLVAISGNAAFTVSAQPTANTVAGCANLTFSVQYSPTVAGTQTATISIANDDTSGSENPYTFTVQGTSYIPVPEINITGNGISIIGDGTNTPGISDDTDFGSHGLNTLVARTFTIENTGDADLTITSISVGGVFSITGTPFSSPVVPGGTTTFTVTGTPTTAGFFSETVTVSNNDSDEGSYQFNVTITGEEVFFDSDGDGVFDNVDIDDDNDGIKDADEELACRNSSVATTANYKFLNETFGAGTRTTINGGGYPATTTYCYEDGSGTGPNTSECPSLESKILDDGEYTVVSKITGTLASDPENIHGDLAWYQGTDHTGDPNGRMAVFNASFTPGIFYETTITGVLSNVPVTYSFWVLNIMAQATYPGSILPNVTVQFVDASNTEITSINTGEIGRCGSDVNDNSCVNGVWQQFSTSVNLGNINEFTVRFINNAPGGGGNDLALDDIVISQTLCDSDSDGVADIFDLDSDNDGIPDVVESGNAQYSGGTAKIPAGVWVDSNGNGMNDASESIIPIDSDGDGVPNYLDLDSDNDTIFDVDESGTGNTNAVAGYENGDGDITGDGVGDGLDTDAYRETDIDSDGILEYFTDGILDIYDYFNNPTFVDSYGNTNQGTSPLYVKDTDSDGIPDYMDMKSNGVTFDIAGTLYASLDADNNGVIDDTIDTEGDGIVDLFDTNDAAFGSPRDLDRKLQLYFDGRNDYMEEEGTDIVNGLSQATLMAWVKLDPSFASNGAVMGQSNFWIRINDLKKLFVEINGSQLTAPVTSALELNVWTHVAAVYDGSNTLETVKLYVNGEKVDSTNIAAMRPNIAASTNTKFRIGRNPSNLDIYNTTADMFKGEIDEVRVFDKALSDDELQKMVYQELDDVNSFNRGVVIPLDISATIGSNLIRYYRMDVYKDDISDNLTTPTVDLVAGAKLYNIKNIYPQTAPLPYETSANGDWSNASTWLYGNVWDIANEATNKDWSIVHVKNDLTTSFRHSICGLIIDNAKKLTVQSDKELKNTWYLELDGVMDLTGESQLVQTEGAVLDQDSGGYMEQDQQGTANSFNYNYWASSVGPISGNSSTRGTGIPSINTSYQIGGVLEDGTTSTAPAAINFQSSYTAADGTPTIPRIISTYWLYTFNGTDNDYNSWVQIDQNSSILAGEGYTMKGTSGAVPITTNQNYVFKGKPYNGTVTLPIVLGNDRLIGNPYPSAIDADEFIKDNIKETINSKIGRNAKNIFNGALYFWDHFGELNTHILKEYVGGYATYTLMGGVRAISTDYRITSNNASGTKIPKQYIPVNQGFFVIAALDASLSGTTSTIDGGDILFKNSQRIFMTESSGNSVFMKGVKSKKEAYESNANSDTRPKIWLQFDSPTGYHRQLLVGVDENASNSFDIGYDAPIADINKEDMYWTFDDSKFVIQGVNNFDVDQELPLGLIVSETGQAQIKIDTLENVSENTSVYIKDRLIGETYDITKKPFEINLEAGTYNDRFSLTFQPRLKTLEEIILRDGIQIFMNNSMSELRLKRIVDTKIECISLFNYLGQIVHSWNTNLDEISLSLPINNASAGVYIVQIKTTNGIVNRKIILNK